VDVCIGANDNRCTLQRTASNRQTSQSCTHGKLLPVFEDSNDGHIDPYLGLDCDGDIDDRDESHAAMYSIGRSLSEPSDGYRLRQRPGRHNNDDDIDDDDDDGSLAVQPGGLEARPNSTSRQSTITDTTDRLPTQLERATTAIHPYLIDLASSDCKQTFKGSGRSRGHVDKPAAIKKRVKDLDCGASDRRKPQRRKHDDDDNDAASLLAAVESHDAVTAAKRCRKGLKNCQHDEEQEDIKPNVMSAKKLAKGPPKKSVDASSPVASLDVKLVIANSQRQQSRRNNKCNDTTPPANVVCGRKGRKLSSKESRLEGDRKRKKTNGDDAEQGVKTVMSSSASTTGQQSASLTTVLTASGDNTDVKPNIIGILERKRTGRKPPKESKKCHRKQPGGGTKNVEVDGQMTCTEIKVRLLKLRNKSIYSVFCTVSQKTNLCYIFKELNNSCSVSTNFCIFCHIESSF